MAADNVTLMESTVSALLQSLADETAYQLIHGPRDSYSLEGKSHDWPGWRAAVLKLVAGLRVQIQNERPFMTVSRGRV